MCKKLLMKIMDNTSDEEVDKSKKSKKRKKAKRYTSDEEFEEFIDERKIKAKTKGDNIVNVRNKTEVEDDLDGKAKVKRKSWIFLFKNRCLQDLKERWKVARRGLVSGFTRFVLWDQEVSRQVDVAIKQGTSRCLER